MPKKPLAAQAPTEQEIERATSIEPTAIQEEYAALPSDVHRWARLLADADHALGLAEQLVEDVENTERVRILDEAEKAEAKPPSEDRLKARVRADEKYRQACKFVLDRKQDKARIFAVLEAVRAKKDMLVSLGADLRAEAEREILIRDRVGSRPGR